MPRGLTSPPLRCTCARYGCDKQFYSYPDRRGSTGKYQKYCCRACYQEQRRRELDSARQRADPDAVKSVTLAVSLNEVRTILAALGRRCSELESLGGPQAVGLAAEVRQAYQSIDRQVYVSRS
jgi:hypothetical protein